VRAQTIKPEALWKAVRRQDAERRRRDRRALAAGQMTPQQLRDRSFWFAGATTFRNTDAADRALLRCLRQSKRGR